MLPTLTGGVNKFRSTTMLWRAPPVVLDTPFTVVGAIVLSKTMAFWRGGGDNRGTTIGDRPRFSLEKFTIDRRRFFDGASRFSGDNTFAESGSDFIAETGVPQYKIAIGGLPD